MGSSSRDCSIRFSEVSTDQLVVSGFPNCSQNKANEMEHQKDNIEKHVKKSSDKINDGDYCSYINVTSELEEVNLMEGLKGKENPPLKYSWKNRL